MTRRRALVSQTRMPELDRDRGSERVDGLIRSLLDDGWSVTFLADEHTPDERHAHRLRQLGVATFAGFASATDVIANGRFDLAVLAFWQQSARLLPLLREISPTTKVIIDSIDVHFLRDTRRQLGVDGRIDSRYGAQMVDELNTYQAADAVLAVSAKEAELLGDFLGADRVHHLALGESTSRSPIPFEQRRGSLFVGNFRHLPNGEAVEYLCRDILPRIEPRLLVAHPLTVIGNRLDDKIRSHAVGLPGVRMVGWVPSVLPYLQQARLSIVPLLHGAGVKGKVIQSMMSGTPVVTTAIGAEGLELVAGEHAYIADTPPELATAISHLLVDAPTWNLVADAGYEHVRARHDNESVRARFREIVEGVLDDRRPTVHPDGFRHGRARMEAYRATTAAVRGVVPTITDPGAVVLVVSRGDDDLLELDDRMAWHFPQAPDGGWAGHHPVDSDSAIRDLETMRGRGAAYLVLPSPAFWWLHYYPEFTAHLDRCYRRVHADEHAIVYELCPVVSRAAEVTARKIGRERVLVMGTYAGERTEPPPSLVGELERSERFAVTQRWEPVTLAADHLGRSSTEEADWVVSIDDNAVLPSGFLDDFVSLQARLGADRAQPAHTAGPAFGPPVTERLLGCLGREVTTWTPLPVRVVRAGADNAGPVVLIDEVAIGLARPIGAATDAEVLDVFVAGDDGPSRAVRRSRPLSSPRLSVLIATYDRPQLLAGCLEGFCQQVTDADLFEVVVVDDGSPDAFTRSTIDEFAGRLPLVSARVDHAGRSAAKNLAVMLARGDLVLFFDDDDRPASDLVAQHLRAHDQAPDEGTAVLGFTDWAPELSISPLMHYLTDIDKILFSYGNLTDGQQLDWRGFWEGRVSCKRSLLMRCGLHDQRLAYSIDVEMAWRLAAHGLKVTYDSAACSSMARAIDFDEFCARIEAKGRAQALIANLHDDAEIRAYTKVDGAADQWAATRAGLSSAIARVKTLEAEVAGDDHGRVLPELHLAYREVFASMYAKGVTETRVGTARAVAPVPAHTSSDAPVATRRRAPLPRARPALTVTIPVWSRTEELAEMAEHTIERLWEVARVDIEVVVVDNGSPFERPFAADVFRYDSNRGVAIAWNAGIALAKAPVIAVLNSDCLVQPGWDEALLQAVTDGRRIAFPYTDHGDGGGFRCPDQAGTAGWCFMMTTDVYREIGPFDEQFSPAYCEDTDYWHRAWQLGIELTPVPAARVRHARRTTGRSDPHADWLLQAHRYKYGWKHGVDPLRAPPYYNRPIIEYTGRRLTSE